MTRVIHTGDTHLGYQQYHLPERREDFLAAFRRVVEDAVDEGVDAVVHAGDLFHDRRPDLPDLLGTLSVLRTLDDADIPFLAVVGNHESKRDGQWLDLFESMGLATRLSAEPVVIGDTAFYGMDFVPRSQRDDLDYQFEPYDADQREASKEVKHAALVTHGLFEPLVPDYGNVEWDADEVLEAANVDFQAMLLGDEHTPERVEIGDTWVTYCGSTERASASEREERGYNIVEFAEGEASITRRGIPTRAFEFIDVPLGDGEGIERVREQVSQYDLADAVAIVTIDGDGEEVKPARVEEFVHEQGALVARVTDRRETTEETEIEVSFADPDDAVRERVREMGLSPAARDLDETIRASKIADSNVADEVESRVRDIVDEGDDGAFAPARGDVETETVADRMQGDAAADGGGSDPDDTDDTDAAPTSTPEETDAEPASASIDDDPPVDTAEESTEQPSGIDDQSSMEDYL